MFRLNNIILRAFELRDLPPLTAMHNDLDLEISAEPSCPVPRMEFEFRDRLLAGRPAVSSGGADDVEFVISRADDPDRRMLGIAGLYGIDLHNRHAEVGVVIADPDARGQGLGIDAYVLLTIYALQVRPLNRVYGQVKSSNTQALGTMLRMGLQPEAILRQHRWVRGRWEDLHVFGLLRSEMTERMTDWRELPSDDVFDQDRGGDSAAA